MSRRHETSVQEKPRSPEPPPPEEQDDEVDPAPPRFNPGFWITLTIWFSAVVATAIYELIALVWR